MSKSNPLGLLASYGDSDEEIDDGPAVPPRRIENKSLEHPGPETVANHQPISGPAGIHPAPISHCPWSACYDENSGFTYYWNQQTNAVTWEAPPEYLLALKLAQQQLHSLGSTEVSAEEWQLYQQALAEKQNSHKVVAKVNKTNKKPDKNVKDNKNIKSKKRPASDDEDEKIELITSYHNSDSESNDELEKPPKSASPKAQSPKPAQKLPKNPQKKQKTKPHVEFGPTLPPNQNYTVPIGPELPPTPMPKSPEKEIVKDEDTKSVKSNDEDSQDESTLLKRLKDKAKLLEKLGGELPTELQKIIKDESNASSPKDSNLDIDDLLEEIEKTEFKVKAKTKNDGKSNTSSVTNSPRGDKTPPLEELRNLYPMNGPSLFPSAINIDESKILKPEKDIPIEIEKKENVYLMDASETIEKVNRKKLRISNSVLPERKRETTEVPTYTTKYSQFIEGFSSERTGLGFTKEEDSVVSPKNMINYGNGLSFTKGETLNEEKKDEDLDELTEVVEAKLKFLNQLQPCVFTPLQEMLIQMQTLVSAFRSGALASSYWRRWAEMAASALLAHEAAAAPAGWLCVFQRSEGRYCYRRESDGFVQYEYPAVANTDMDICTTPPHPSTEPKEEPNPPLALPLPLPLPLPPPTPPRHWRATPPPPGTDTDLEPPPPPRIMETKKEIGDELLSFYNDIAEMEKSSTGPPTPEPQPPLPPAPPVITAPPAPPAPPAPRISEENKERDSRVTKKKSKVKLSSSMGMKHKSVSSLVAKWQQVADEINSD